MKRKQTLTVFLQAMVLFSGTIVLGENIDPNNDDSQYAYGENVGWLNFEPNTGDGVQVASDKLTGFVWAENIGWMSLSCENTSSCGTVNYGVTNDGSGNLSGYAWAENVGWINFNPIVPGDPIDYGVKIDADGNFDGWAWGENIGWIRFDSTKTYNVQACKVTLEDFANFSADWLQSGPVPGNLDGEDPVDLSDLEIFVFYWLDFCPDDWQL
jgi:hypothetical protein